jgi:hypothetical protein
MPSAKPAAVGGFVLGALIIVVVAILFFGGPQAFSSKTKAVVYFDGSVGGLGPGSPVTFRGVRVGSVSAVALLVDAKRMKARIPVRLKLEPDRVTLVSGSTGPAMLRGLIEAGLKARLEPESLVTGQMLVDWISIRNYRSTLLERRIPTCRRFPRCRQIWQNCAGSLPMLRLSIRWCKSGRHWPRSNAWLTGSTR